MDAYKDGYLQALVDVQFEVRQMVQDSSTSSEAALELLGVLSFVSGLIDGKVTRDGGHGTEGASDENARGHDE